jgi:hypothetical protein
LSTIGRIGAETAVAVAFRAGVLLSVLGAEGVGDALAGGVGLPVVPRA